MEATAAAAMNTAEARKQEVAVMNQEFAKLDKFDGTNFTRWQEKVLFLLRVLNYAYLLDPNLAPIPEDPVVPEGTQPTPAMLLRVQELQQQRKTRIEEEEKCRGHIMNTLSDRLFDLYTRIKNPRELWERLEFKYKAEEQGTNKYLISKYLDFKMFDDKPILDQVHDLQVIVNRLTIIGIILPEIFQVGAIIAKLPPSWKNFAKKMLHKSEDYSMEQIQMHLRIEEEARKRDRLNLVHGQSKTSVHHLEAGSSKNKKTRVPIKRNDNKFKNPNKQKTFQKKGKCHVCGETGHYARDCKDRKSGNNGHANMVEENLVAMVSKLSLDVTMISEINMANETSGWYLDSGATVHVCNNKEVFKTFEETVDY